MDFNYSNIIEIFESRDFHQVNLYLSGGWKYICYSNSRDVHILGWTNFENKPQHYPSSLELWAKDLNDQEHTTA